MLGDEASGGGGENGENGEGHKGGGSREKSKDKIDDGLSGKSGGKAEGGSANENKDSSSPSQEGKKERGGAGQHHGSALRQCENNIASILGGASLRELGADITKVEIELRVMKARAGTIPGDRGFERGLTVFGGDGTDNGGAEDADLLMMAGLGRPLDAQQASMAIKAAKKRLEEELVAAADGIKGQGLTSSRAIYDEYFEGTEKSTSSTKLGVPWWVTAVLVVLFLAFAERAFFLIWGLALMVRPKVAEFL